MFWSLNKNKHYYWEVTPNSGGADYYWVPPPDHPPGWNSGSSGGTGPNDPEWYYTLSASIKNIRREGRYVKADVYANATSKYYGTLYINGTSKGSKTNVNGVSWTDAHEPVSWDCPGEFSSRGVAVRIVGYGVKSGQSVSSFDATVRPTTGNIPAMAIPINFDSNGGSAVEMSIKSYGNAYGELPIPTRPGYKFIGWYTQKKDGELINNEDIIKRTEGFTLYAHWEPQTVFHLIQNGRHTLAPLAYIVENGSGAQAIGMYVVENETAYQCV